MIETRFTTIAKREWKRLFSRPIYMFCMVVGPLFCLLLLTTLMGSGLPVDMPVGVVDLDQSPTSRSITRNLDSFQQIKVVAHYPNFNDARIAVQRGDIYGFYYIPDNLSRDANAQRQPIVSFYTNNAYLIAGSLMFRDMKTMSEMAAGAAMRSVLIAKGATNDQAMGFLQPISVTTHALGNPWVSYSIYLCNVLVPGIMGLLIFMVTVFSIGTEVQDTTSKEWLRLSGNSMWVALFGKLIPHTIIWLTVATICDVVMYGILDFPCECGIGIMILANLLYIMAAQAMGVFMYGLLPTLRLGLSFASLWGVLSISMSGSSFPVMAMHEVLQILSNLFPLRHFFMIYSDQALNGYPLIYSWTSCVGLMLFMLLPFAVISRLKNAMITCKYRP